MPKQTIKWSYLLTLTVFLASLLFTALPRAYAYTSLFNRSIKIGSSAGGANTTHQFSFNFPLAESVGSLEFEYCTDPIDEITCDAPAGLNVAAASLDAQSGETGFSLGATTASDIILTRPDATVGTQINTYLFSNIINPTNIGPFYVRIKAYTSTDASGSYISHSSVAAAIVTGVSVSAEVPQILYFCSAVSIPTNCSDATGDFIEFGALSPNYTSFATSQFMVGTNAPNGYAVTANGPTMTSGTDEINPVIPTAANKNGIGQFGLNLRANLAPLVGADKVGGDGTAAPNYSVPNKYYFTPGDIVAQGPGPTEISLYTVSYVVNVPAGQPAGIYNTTLTYVCTAGF